MPGRAGRWDGSLTRRPARRPSGVAVWGFCKSLVQLIKDTLTQGGQDLFCGGGDVLYKDHVYDLAQLEDLQVIPHTADTIVLELIATHNYAGENEGFGVDDIQLTVYPPPGTLFTLR